MRNQKGITLIALVITIIVLLILAGVSIAMLTGENGILTNASESQQKTDYENACEQIDIALQAIKTEALAKMVDNNSYDPKDDITHLTSTDIIGSAIKETGSGYLVTPTTPTSSDGVITISYSNTATKVEVNGKIDLDEGSTGGTITKATGTIDGQAQS